MFDFLQKNITPIKYGLIIVNIFFMIIAIKAVVNYQNILISIDTIQQDIKDKNDHTNYINNFVTPYLKSDYAPYFFAHENNQVFPGEKLIKLVEVDSGSLVTTTGAVGNTNNKKPYTTQSAQKARNKYIQEITQEVKFRK